MATESAGDSAVLNYPGGDFEMPVHSATEGKGYLRLVDARTGRSTVEDSTFVYEICQEVCSGNPDEQSCLVYVPFEQRYRNKPDCLK